MTGQYSKDGVTFDLQSGDVQVDLAQFQGGDLNNLPVNTELLSDAVVSAVMQSITGTVSSLADQLVDRVDTALHNANVGVHANLDLLNPQAASQVQQCTDTQVPIIGDVLGTGGLLDGLGLGGVTQGIVGYTTQTVCDLVDQALPDLKSTVNLDIEGTVDQLLNGNPPTSDATVSLLGGAIAPTLDVNSIVDGIGAGLLDGLFSPDGAVASLTDSLDTNLVQPAVDGLLGATGVGTALKNFLSVKANVQDTSMASPKGNAVAAGSYFTQTAVRVSALNGAATLNVAAATVGPNITTIVDPGCTVNCGPGGDPGCTVNCGPGTTTTTAAADSLAYTGTGIATLIAIILALLAAGAYLAREGYRRNHTKSLTSD
jgi:hypothetical protein